VPDLIAGGTPLAIQADMHTVNLEKARKMLPKMPQEVFDLWIAPLVESDGWPFNTVMDIAIGRWGTYLDGHTLNSLSNLNWKRQNLSSQFTGFSPNTKRLILALMKQYVFGVQTLQGRIKNGPARFRRALDYIRAYRTLPRPVILIQNFFHYDLMDGNHRLAALMASGLANQVNVPAWIGSTLP
jgi:hypothetical protein